MRLSSYYMPMLKENPVEATTVSHKLMLRGGYVRPLASGIYSWLPIGLRVLRKIESIVREEMDMIGGMEILMPAIQPADLWIESGRYDSYGQEMLRMCDRKNRDMLFGPTHEEVATDLLRKDSKSAKELPVLLYQLQWKFRDEIRPRFGVMRGREFYMKDGYGFSSSEEDAVNLYKKIYGAYVRIFRRLGLFTIGVRADSGCIGGTLSHEFHIMAETGESELSYDKNLEKETEIDNFDIVSKYFAAAKEVNETPPSNIDIKHGRGIEVGHVFFFGQKYSESMKLKLATENGSFLYPFMGSYGIGLSRLVGAIIESSHDADGIIWTDATTPFDCLLIDMTGGEKTEIVENFYKRLSSSGIDVLIDDTKDSPGVKMKKAFLSGITKILVFGKKTTDSDAVEIIFRKTSKSEIVSKDEAISKISESKLRLKPN